MKTTIATLRASSEASWAGCVDTAGIADFGESWDQSRADAAASAADAASEAWDRAEDALDRGDRTAALEALEEARALAAEWGEDSDERSAIELVSAEDEDEAETCESCGRPVCPVCHACEACGPTCDHDEAPWREDEEEDDDEGMVTVEYMPAHLRASHRAAGDWGVYPLNGAERVRMSLEDAEEAVAADEDGYDHIVRS